ncbi:MAG: hypothetical protein ACOC38_09390 [Promethearchaeia archaeon]
MQDKVIIDIEIRKSDVELSLDASDKDVAERDFDSLIQILRSYVQNSQNADFVMGRNGKLYLGVFSLSDKVVMYS